MGLPLPVALEVGWVLGPLLSAVPSVFPDCFKDGILRRTKVVALGRWAPPLAPRWGCEKKRGRHYDQGLYLSVVAQSPLGTYLRFRLQQGNRDGRVTRLGERTQGIANT